LVLEKSILGLGPGEKTASAFSIAPRTFKFS
jgi:hypothetical protein